MYDPVAFNFGYKYLKFGNSWFNFSPNRRFLLFQCDYSNRGNWNKIMQAQRFLKTKGSEFFFFGKRTNKIQDSAMKPLKTLKVLDLSDLSGNGPQIHESHSGPFFYKKLEHLLFQKTSDWIIFFQVPQFE